MTGLGGGVTSKPGGGTTALTFDTGTVISFPLWDDKELLVLVTVKVVLA